MPLASNLFEGSVLVSSSAGWKARLFLVRLGAGLIGLKAGRTGELGAGSSELRA